RKSSLRSASPRLLAVPNDDQPHKPITSRRPPTAVSVNSAKPSRKRGPSIPEAGIAWHDGSPTHVGYSRHAHLKSRLRVNLKPDARGRHSGRSIGIATGQGQTETARAAKTKRAGRGRRASLPKAKISRAGSARPAPSSTASGSRR